MSDECPKITVSFVVGGDDFDAEQLTQIVQVKPTRIWSQKIPELREREDLTNYEWEYEIQKLESWSLDEAVLQAIELFWGKREALCDFTRKNRLKTSIICYVYNKENDPLYIIAQPTLKKLVELDAEFALRLDN